MWAGPCDEWALPQAVSGCVPLAARRHGRAAFSGEKRKARCRFLADPIGREAERAFVLRTRPCEPLGQAPESAPTPLSLRADWAVGVTLCGRPGGQPLTRFAGWLTRSASERPRGHPVRSALVADLCVPNGGRPPHAAARADRTNPFATIPRTAVNESADGICIWRLMKHFGEISGQGGHIGLELGPAAPLDLLSTLGQAGEEGTHLLLNGRLGAQRRPGQAPSNPPRSSAARSWLSPSILQ
jgi:hypothetical protein